MHIDFVPTDPFTWVVSQTLIDEVSGVITYINSSVIWASIFDLFEDLHICFSIKGILSIKKLIIDDSN